MKKLYGVIVFTLLAGLPTQVVTSDVYKHCELKPGAMVILPWSKIFSSFEDKFEDKVEDKVESYKTMPQAKTPKGRELINYIEYKVAEHKKLYPKPVSSSYENNYDRSCKDIRSLLGRFNRLK